MQSLIDYSTFHVPVQAQKILTISKKEDILDFINHNSLEERKKCLILGRGSNVLFTQDFNDIILLNKIVGKKIIKESNTHIVVSIGSGENRNDIVEWSVDNNYNGIENLVAIPGTVGGTPVQNIGAYGTEIGDTIMSVEGIDLITGEENTYTNEQCQFSYRNSIFKKNLKNGFFITNIILQLNKVDSNYHPKIHYGDIETVLLVQGRDGIESLSPRQVADAIATIRASKLPDWTKLGTAGSFFQNPIIEKDIYNDLKKQYPDLSGYIVSQDKVKLSAGEMIELVGMKGYRNGDAGVYEKHALILVNYGNASGQDIKDLIELIQTKVNEKFGIELIPEVNIY